ncbi:MAG: IS256 family transposase [Candidatus Competibacteraceae bacterium]|nr:IS256 family transposase [Candidatus Competibacteraceae bacterium]
MTQKKKNTEPTPAPALFVEPGLLKELVETTVRQLLEEEVARHLGAGPYERSGERRGYRNGTKPRTMKTSVGELRFEVPQVRESGFRTQLFERWQRSDKALVAAMQEMVVKGVSTRRVSDVLEEMGGFEVSAATVSKTMAELDASIEAFFSRPLDDCAYPYLMVDARYEKVRKDRRVRSQAVLVVAGIRDDGRRDLLALALGDSESLDTWGEMFAGLKRRGLRGVELLVSDAHRGIRAAAEKHFQGAAWQRCRVHFMREMMGKVSYKNYSELAADLRGIYASEEREQCLEVAEEVASKWEARYPKLAGALRDGVDDTLTVWDYGRKIRRKLNSTNMIERLMKEIKKRTRIVGSFPNEQACLRLVGAVLLETQDAWDIEDKRYIVFED